MKQHIKFIKHKSNPL